MTRCDDLSLDGLLDTDDEDVGEGDRFDEAAKHVESCVRCQSRLAWLAAEDRQWEQAKEWLAPNALGDEAEVDASVARERWGRPTAWTESMAEALLSDPTHPEMLGRIGRYDVERLIGSGGMGLVFKAHDTELNRPVAIKLLAPYLAENRSSRKRFAREAHAAAAVMDEHVVPIHNVESEGDTTFLVMRYIAGGSLQQRIDREGPRELCEILRLGMHTARGLAAAHAQGLIHRDVKPSNILLDESVGRALLTDFGLARSEDDACLTRTGFHPGTPHYMSPEQVRGEAIDARSDLFSLGCVLYALCAGHPPFRAESSYAVLRRITDERARPIREVNPDIPRWLELIVARLLSKSREDRFDSAAEVADVLEGCLAHTQHPSTMPLPPIVAGNGTWGRSRWGKLIAVATFAALMILATRFVLESRKGTLRIETNSELDVRVMIRQQGKMVEELTVSKEGARVRLSAGNYIIEVPGGADEYEIKRNEVSLSRGGLWLATIEVVDKGDPLPDRPKGEASSLPRTAGLHQRSQSVQFAISGPEGTRFDYDRDGRPDATGRLNVSNDEFPDGILIDVTHRAHGKMIAHILPLAESSSTPWVQHNAVSIQLTDSDLQQSAAGNVVTKATYLPRDSSAALGGQEVIVSTRVDPGIDVVVEAKRRGVALACVSLRRADDGAAGRTGPYAPAERKGLGKSERAPFAAGSSPQALADADIELSGEAVPLKTVIWNLFGATLSETPEPELAGTEWEAGLTITHLMEHGPAEEALLDVGDCVVAIGRQAIGSLKDIDRSWQDTDWGAPVTVKFLRDGEEGNARLKWNRAVVDAVTAEGLVLSREEGEVIVSLGTDDGVYPGDRLTIQNGVVFSVADVVLAMRDRSRARVISEQLALPMKVGDRVTVGQVKLRTPPEESVTPPGREGRGSGEDELLGVRLDWGNASSRNEDDSGGIPPLIPDGSWEFRRRGSIGSLKALKPVSLDDAVATFNAAARTDAIGRQRRELTVDEVVGAFRAWMERPECTDETAKDFQQIVDTKRLRPGHLLLFDSKRVTDGFVFDVWTIQFGDDDTYAWFKIRNTTLSSRRKTAAEQKAWETLKQEMARSFDRAKRGGPGHSSP